MGLAFNDFWITTHSRIVSPTYGGAVYLGFEPMTCVAGRNSFELRNF